MVSNNYRLIMITLCSLLNFQIIQTLKQVKWKRNFGIEFVKYVAKIFLHQLIYVCTWEYTQGKDLSFVPTVGKDLLRKDTWELILWQCMWRRLCDKGINELNGLRVRERWTIMMYIYISIRTRANYNTTRIIWKGHTGRCLWETLLYRLCLLHNEHVENNAWMIENR